MPKFAANLTMMFTEVAFIDRFEAAAQAGFEAVEYLFPYDDEAEAIADKLEQFNLTQAMFNLPPGDWSAGDRGIAVFPSRFEEFKASVDKAVSYAQTLKVHRLHMMAGLADKTDSIACQNYLRCVDYAAKQLAQYNIQLLLEPINTRSMPGYFLNDFAQAMQIITSLNHDNIRLQFDIFHRQIIHGDITIGLRDLIKHIGHIQIANVPSRHEPDGEEINYPYLFKLIDEIGYTGFVGSEYNPRGKTTDGLSWFQSYKRKRV